MVHLSPPLGKALSATRITSDASEWFTARNTTCSSWVIPLPGPAFLTRLCDLLAQAAVIEQAA